MTEIPPRCVIVGAGHAAAQLCASLHQGGWPGSVTLIGEEDHAPYHRPPLSKAQLDPQADEEVQLIRPIAFYDEAEVTRITGQRVTAIDRANKQVAFGGQTLGYDTLVLSTGSKHRLPPIPGIDLPHVMSLHKATDAERIKAKTESAKRIVVIGAGFIGLEVAASLRKHGVHVTVLELSDRVLSRVTTPEVSSYFEDLHRGNGVRLLTDVSASNIAERGDGLEVTTSQGETLPADFVVVGAGAAANDDLARDAGLDVDNGIVVNEFNQTSDPAIYAMGDCCNQHHPLYDTRLRLESVQNATDQAKTVAKSMLGRPAAHDALPWFWSDQYDVKFQIAGISTDHSAAVSRGEPTPGEPFSVWYFDGDRLIAVDAVNDARAYTVGSKLIPKRGRPDPAAIADPSVDLKTILKSAQGA
ncbi:MAG: FAD-dependent oxidoreductase [Planctomycetota bacterium]